MDEYQLLQDARDRQNARHLPEPEPERRPWTAGEILLTVVFGAAVVVLLPLALALKLLDTAIDFLRRRFT